MTAIAESTALSVSINLRDLIAGEMERTGVPGIAIGILNGDEEIAEGFGVTNVDHPLPVTADTYFQIGSTTKTVTALVAMRLVEQGKLGLDEPVRTYLPDVRLSDHEVTERLTLRNLLTHTGGFEGDYFCDFGRGEDALEKAVASMSKLGQTAPLGEVWSYCNSGFYIVGRLIEVITGKPYEAAARELVLEPLGLTDCFYFPEEVMTHRFAVGHATLKDVHVVTPWSLPRVSNVAGGIISTVRNDLKYARFLMGDGTAQDGSRLLAAESMALMQSPLFQTSGNEWIGLTWFNREVDGIRIVRHGGATNGQTSAFMFAPKRRFALTVHTNGARPEVHRAISEWVLAEYLDISEPKPASQDVSREELAELAGTYDDIAATLILTLVDSGLSLRIIPKPEAGAAITNEPPPDIPPMGVAICGADQIVITDGMYKDISGDIIRRNGEIRWLRLGGRIHTRDA